MLFVPGGIGMHAIDMYYQKKGLTKVKVKFSIEFIMDKFRVSPKKGDIPDVMFVVSPFLKDWLGVDFVGYCYQGFPKEEEQFSLRQMEQTDPIIFQNVEDKNNRNLQILPLLGNSKLEIS